MSNEQHIVKHKWTILVGSLNVRLTQSVGMHVGIFLYSRCPVDSIRDAVLTVSPNKQYLGIFIPTTPAAQGPGHTNTNTQISSQFLHPLNDIKCCTLRLQQLISSLQVHFHPNHVHFLTGRLRNNEYSQGFCAVYLSGRRCVSKQEYQAGVGAGRYP